MQLCFLHELCYVLDAVHRKQLLQGLVHPTGHHFEVAQALVFHRTDGLAQSHDHRVDTLVCCVHLQQNPPGQQGGALLHHVPQRPLTQVLTVDTLRQDTSIQPQVALSKLLRVSHSFLRVPSNDGPHVLLQYGEVVFDFGREAPFNSFLLPRRVKGPCNFASEHSVLKVNFFCLHAFVAFSLRLSLAFLRLSPSELECLNVVDLTVLALLTGVACQAIAHVLHRERLVVADVYPTDVGFVDTCAQH